MMFGYGRSTQSAIAAVSLLAEVYDGPATKYSAADIAQRRNLQKPFVAKLLTILAQARLVSGSPGPGGGYMLARPPGQITLYDIARLFERENAELTCPLGRGRCGHTPPCPLHESIHALDGAIHTFLTTTTFEVFRKPPEQATMPAKSYLQGELPGAADLGIAPPA